MGGCNGWGGQRLMIVPALVIVALVLAWLPNNKNLPESILLDEFILPAAMTGDRGDGSWQRCALRYAGYVR